MNNGAFVEVQNERLSRHGLVLLGAREGLDRWIDKLRQLVSLGQQPGVAKVMTEIAEAMAQDRDDIATELTRMAIREGSGSMHEIKRD